MFVKDADPLIIEDLKKRNLLFKEELYEHDYPFCWRCDSPLLYYAKESWFINMQKVKKQLIENNQKDKLDSCSFKRRQIWGVAKRNKRLGIVERKILGNTSSNLGM